MGAGPWSTETRGTGRRKSPPPGQAVRKSTAASPASDDIGVAGKLEEVIESRHLQWLAHEFECGLHANAGHGIALESHGSGKMAPDWDFERMALEQI